MMIRIRKAIITDLKNLAVLKQQVWISTYATEGLTDQFSHYVLSKFSLDSVRNTLSDNNRIILLAFIGKCVVGCAEILLSSECPIRLKNPSIELLTLYVLEKFRGLGIGKKLMDECIKEIKRQDHKTVWLTVYHKNHNAVEFYTKQNFNHLGDTFFNLGDDKHKNYVMVKDL